MEVDLKSLLKSFRLSVPQKRLLNAICREPASHLYSTRYMVRHDLTRGGIDSALRRLRGLNLVAQEDGVWQIVPPELRKWYQAVMDCDWERAEDLRFAEMENPYFWKIGINSIYQECLEVFRDFDNAMRWLRAPNHSLGGRIPWDILETVEGVDLVKKTLGRIKYGVYS